MPLRFFIGTLKVGLSLALRSLPTFVQTNSLFPYVTRSPEVGSCWDGSAALYCSQAISIFHLFYPYFVNLKHYACCLVLQDVYSSRHSSPHSRQKEGSSGKMSFQLWPYKSFPRNAFCKSPLKSHWPELSHGHSVL